MNSYGFLAGCYDEFTTDVDYAAWAEYIQRHFERAGLPGSTVLDLACGTGSLTRELSLRGYEMIGVDLSPDMLAQAAEKNRDAEGIAPIFLCQSMDQLDLYGTIDACVCCLDSINYVTDPKKLRRAFQRVHLFLMPGGLFLFDVNTPAKLEGLDGQVFLDETEDAYCVWRTEFSRKICSYWVDLFRREKDGRYRRSTELHRQRYYAPDELTQWLREAGFGNIRVYGDCRLRRPTEGEQRIYFCCTRE